MSDEITQEEQMNLIVDEIINHSKMQAKFNAMQTQINELSTKVSALESRLNSFGSVGSNGNN